MFLFLSTRSNQDLLQSPSLQVPRPISCSGTHLPWLHWRRTRTGSRESNCCSLHDTPCTTTAYLDVGVQGWVHTVDCEMDGQRCGEREACHDHMAGRGEGEDLKAVLLEPPDLLF